ncbi:hypothetical protein J2T17_002078 [Paenibacillus mucilaginosus]
MDGITNVTILSRAGGKVMGEIGYTLFVQNVECSIIAAR